MNAALHQRTQAVPCPVCGAPPGARCTGPGGPRGKTHYARATAARRWAAGEYLRRAQARHEPEGA